MKFAVVVLLLVGCASKPTFEERIKNYMRDSIVVNFNDPKSYEFISMTTDSVFNHEITRKHLNEYEAKLNNDNSDGAKEIYTSSIAQLKKELSEPDYLYRVNARVRYRAKNKLGALAVDDLALTYSPTDNKIKQD